MKLIKILKPLKAKFNIIPCDVGERLKKLGRIKFKNEELIKY